MKICYFGIYDPEFGRNKVYMRGLRELGHEIVECRDASGGLKKFWRLWRRHRDVLRQGGYDAMVVGYPGHLVAPFAKWLSKKPVVFDALCALHEGEVISRGRYRRNPFMRAWIDFIDEAAVKAADAILVETEAQRAYFMKRFDMDGANIHRVFTGADEETFNAAVTAAAEKRPRFTAVFRGKFLPEAGVRHIIAAAEKLGAAGIDLLILGHGFLEADVRAQIEATRGQAAGPNNIEWVSDKLPLPELARRMAACHVSLGQFERHERLERTIPHKAFESLALGLPYVTGRAAGVSELLADGETCLMTGLADPADIAAKAIRLKDDPALASRLAANGRKLFADRLTAKELAQGVVAAISACARR